MNERTRLEAWSAAFFLAALAVGVVLALPDEGSSLTEVERAKPNQSLELLTEVESWTPAPSPSPRS